MAPFEDVVEQLRRYEAVEWRYDGLNGKIIPWTKERGGTSEDPSVQAFVLHHDGTLRSRIEDAKTYVPEAFAEWLDEQADAWEREHPRIRMPFRRAEVTPGEGGGPPRCDELMSAARGDRPILLYVGREPREGDGRKEKAEAAASRKLEREALDSESAAKAAEGWVLLQLDAGDPLHAGLAEALGIRDVPALAILRKEANGPDVLRLPISGQSLAAKLKRLEK